MKKWDYILLVATVIAYVSCLLIMAKLNIFQFMLFGQVVPTVLLALLGARIASKTKYKWFIVFVVGIFYALLMYILLSYAPMQSIENNTNQSATSTFEFSKNIGFGTYLGLFFQQFILTAFITFLFRAIQKIKTNNF
ncbi:hypothetical protein [Staphylococcus ratti]|uniref:Uncharacterized protein n=1 Tax=Staphylococcus ratti TaxID=2892440 RepID=A0ABY3PB73_9STAP|nr:hypothetical protein [Staphylococcus ratti]UEX89562.1 hypothetical protein LN051_08280 [Staphylococcus ratti]